MVAYLDSSVVLRAVLAGDRGIHQVKELPTVVSSELMEIECRRGLLRDRSIGILDETGFVTAWNYLQILIDEMEFLQLDAAIKRRAMEAFPVHVKTLDALHLATALAVARAYPEETVGVFSYDQTMNRAAHVLGLAAPWLA